MKRPVLLVVHRAAHHAAKSGYHRLADYLVEQGAARPIHHGFPVRGTWRLTRPFVQRAGLAWYGSDACLTEVWASAAGACQRAVVHFLYGENSYRYAAALPGRRRRTLAASLHLPPSRLRDYVASLRHLERLDALVLLARSQLELLDRFTVRPQAFVVPHGVDTDFYRPPVERSGKGGCLFVGQWLRDFEVLSQVLKILRRAAPSLPIRLVLPADRAAEWTGRLGVEVGVEMPDLELRRWYQEAALLLLPLQDCVANNALLEALASGLPIVATDVGAVREYMDADCGTLVRPGRPAEMAEAVLSLVADDQAREAAGRAARRRAEALAWPAVAQATARVYRALGA